jgi:hypothetical protein
MSTERADSGRAEIGSDVSQGSSAHQVEDLEDITHLRHRCNYSAACPAVFRNARAGSYVIIGATRDPLSGPLAGRVAAYETAIEIPADILEAAVRAVILGKLVSSIQFLSAVRRLKLFRFQRWMMFRAPSNSNPVS